MIIALITLPHTLNYMICALNGIYKDVTRAYESNSKGNRWRWNSQNSSRKMLALINTMALVGV
jgi:hypothetical protein